MDRLADPSLRGRKQVPFLAGPDEADWRYVNLLAILLPLKLFAPAGGVQAADWPSAMDS